MEEIQAMVHEEWFTLYVIPLLICLARIMDVTIGTIRIIFVSKGLKYLAPILGFFEITIWILAIGEVMRNLDNFVNILAYSTGFSIGNLVGILIEGRLAIGMVVMRIITKRDSSDLVERLRQKRYNVTVLEADGNLGPVNVIFMNLKRSRIKDIVPTIHHYNPLATYTIEDVRHVNDPDSIDISPRKAQLKFKNLFLRPRK